MKMRLSSTRSVATGGFTLAEVLAALVFMAVVIPVVVQGLSLAGRTAASASRRYQAALVAERILNESLVTSNYTSSGLSGTVHQGSFDFRWSLRSEWWNYDPNLNTVRLLSVDVFYPMQGGEQQLTMSTLVNEIPLYQQTNSL